MTHCNRAFNRIQIKAALSLAGRTLPGRMSSQQGEAEGRVGNDAESAECHAEVSLAVSEMYAYGALSLHKAITWNIIFYFLCGHFNIS